LHGHLVLLKIPSVVRRHKIRHLQRHHAIELHQVERVAVYVVLREVHVRNRHVSRSAIESHELQLLERVECGVRHCQVRYLDVPSQMD
jgi:hypothetical protein